MRAAEALAAGILALLLAPHPGAAEQGVAAAPARPGPMPESGPIIAAAPERPAAPAAPRAPAAIADPPQPGASDSALSRIDAPLLSAQATISPRAPEQGRPAWISLNQSLRRGADPRLTYEIAVEVDAAAFLQRDPAMRTPLHRAAEVSGDPALIALMVARGADIEARDAEGRTPLHAAFDNPVAAAALIAAGADACEPDVAGRPALDARMLERIRTDAPEAYDEAVEAFLDCL